MNFQNRRSRGRLSAADELVSRLCTIDSFQASIRHADAKAAALLSALAALVAVAAGHLAGLRHCCQAGSAPLGGCVVVGTAFVAGSVLTSIRLLGAVRPRLPELPAGNRFAFPSVARSGYPAAGAVSAQLAEAAMLARLLADIATAKHRAVARSLPWLMMVCVAAMVWLALTGWFE